MGSSPTGSPRNHGRIPRLSPGEGLWRHLIDRYDAYTSADVARLRGAAPTNRSIATRLASAHGLIGFTRSGPKLYPAFELTSGGEVSPHWKPAVTPLLDAGWDDADILPWFVSPHPAIGGREPAELIASDPDRLREFTASAAKGVA